MRHALIASSVIAVCFGFAACGSGSGSNPIPVGFVPAALSTDKKACVDQTLSRSEGFLPAPEQTADENHDQERDQDRNRPEGGNQDVRERSFNQAIAKCGLSPQDRDLYLQYSNVLLGLPPDSLESPQATPGARVILMGSTNRGHVVEIFADGHSTVSWDGVIGSAVAEPPGVLAVMVQARGGIAAKVQVIQRGAGNANRGTVQEVFADGRASVKWSALSTAVVENVAALAAAVSCNGRFCENGRVSGMAAHGYMVGTLKGVFADGRGLIKWDGSIGLELLPLNGLTPTK